MRECKFERLRVGGGQFINNEEAKHREIIVKHAAEGWHYAGYVPLTFTGQGAPKEIDLIFERETVVEGGQ